MSHESFVLVIHRIHMHTLPGVGLRLCVSCSSWEKTEKRCEPVTFQEGESSLEILYGSTSIYPNGPELSMSALRVPKMFMARSPLVPLVRWGRLMARSPDGSDTHGATRTR